MVDRAEQLSTKRLAWVGSAVVGASSGLSVANHLLSIWTRTPPQQVLILLCLTVLFSLVAYGFVFRFARRRLASPSPRTRAVWVLVCLLIGAILLVVVPVEPPLPPTRHHLQIVATGDRHPRSQASEVWILEIQRPDGSILSLGGLRLSEGWELRDGVLVSYQNQPASAQWTGLTTEGDFAVTFVSHPWSGVVEVEWDGNQQRLDLYAAKGTQIPVALPATYGAGRGVDRVLLPAALYGADLVTLAGLVLVTSVWLAAGQVRQYVSNVLTSFSASSKELAQYLSESVRKEDKIHLSTLCLILLLAILLRLSFLSQPMRYDESFTFLNYASRPLVEGLSLYNLPNNHLFHTLLVHMAYLFLGDQPWVIRLPALIAGITLVPASYIAARILFNKHAALLTAGLVAASSPLVEYSTNARGYTLVCLIFVAILALATYLKRSANSAAWALFAVSSALGFYTVPIVLYPFGAVVTWLFLSIILGDANVRRGLLLRNLFLYTGVTAGLTFVLYLPVIVVSGLDSVISNEFVASNSWSVFIGQLPASLQLA